MAKLRTVQIVSHGPACLDGVVAAAVVARFYEGHRVRTTLASNSDADGVLEGLRLRDKPTSEEIWITDLSWVRRATGEHLRELAAAGARIHWVDHHRTAVSRAEAPEFKVPFAAKILSERFSAALLAFNYLRRRETELAPARRVAFESMRRFAEIADDHDRWLHRIDGSADWALAVQTLGGMPSYREILKLKEPQILGRLKQALRTGHEALRRSIELARSTLVEHALSDGLKLRTACCLGYSSEVAAHLYFGTSQTIVALFDLRSQGVSLRRSPDCAVDLASLAENFGGGGHEAASGFSLQELSRLPAERLCEVLTGHLERSGRQPSMF